jgi:hypothetical protein
LKLIFLVVTRAVPVLGLSQRDAWRKDAGILMLRHQLAVALRERPRVHSRLTWPDRAWLALLAGTLPAGRLAAMRLIVTPATILRWHRGIVRRRRARLSRRGRSGRPPVRRNARSVVLRLARENESRGAAAASTASSRRPASRWRRRRPGRSSGTPGPARRRAGTAPGGRSSCGPGRRGSWRWTSSPLTCSTAQRSTSLAVIEHPSRRVRAPGATKHPAQSRDVQQARNLLMDLEDARTRVKFVPHNRDASFTQALDAVFQGAGVRIVRSAVQAPRMNSIMERRAGSCRRELLTLLWNQRHLTMVLRDYEDFYSTRRPHRTLKQAAPLRPLPDAVTDLDHFRVQRRDRAGGVIHEYRLVA